MNEASESSLTWMALGKTSLALIVVLVLILGCAWLLRRVQQGQGYGSIPIRVIGSQVVGQRERIMVVDVEDQRLVVGVTPSSINLLTQLEQKPLPEAAPLLKGSFAERFQQALKHNLKPGKSDHSPPDGG